ncbi:MAG: glycosyltransferase [Prolixibacteraceae bacterium]
MKILKISPAHLKGYKIGGPIASIEAINKGLVNEGISIDVLSTPYGLDNEEDEILNKWQNVDETENYRVKYFKYWGYGNFTFSPKLVIETYKIIKSYDLLVCEGIWNFPLIFSAFIALLKRKPFIFVPRGTLYKETIELKSKFIKKAYYHLIVKHILKRSAGIQFTTQDEKEKVCSYLNINPKCIVVPNCIDSSKYKILPQKGLFLKDYPNLQNKRIIVFFGRITAKKGLDILIEAFHSLSIEFPDLHLVIAGPDEENYSVEVKKWITKYDLSNKCTFIGLLTGENKYSVLVDSEIFVLSSYSENFGMSVIEAMLCGIPVVISNGVGIYNEVSNNNAGVVTDISTVSVHNGIKGLLQNEEMREKYITQAKVFVKEYYDQKIVSKELMKQYKVILNAR